MGNRDDDGAADVTRRDFIVAAAATLPTLSFVGLTISGCGDDDGCASSTDCPEGYYCDFSLQGPQPLRPGQEVQGSCQPASLCSSCTGGSTSVSSCSSCTGGSTSVSSCSSCTGGSTSVASCSSCTGSSTSSSCSSCSSSCRDSCHRSCSGTCSGGCKNLTS